MVSKLSGGAYRRPTSLTILRVIVCAWNVWVLLKRADIVNVQLDDLSVRLFGEAFGSLLARGLCLFDFFLVDPEALLLSHDLREIHREAIRVVQPPHVSPAEFSLVACLCLPSVGLEELLSSVQGTGEGLFLFVEDSLELIGSVGDFGEEGTLWYRR